MQIEIFEIGEIENGNACHASGGWFRLIARGASLDECKAALYKQLADEYHEAQSAMPSHISEANIIEFFAQSDFEIRITQSAS